jgi:enediyne biosynthesis protein E4
VIFTDVTSSAGISFKHTSAARGQKYMVETMGSGCAFLDYNNDGYLDIYLVNGAPLPGFKPQQRVSHALYRNNKDGTFTDVTDGAQVGGEGIYGMGVAVGDYDNDGNEDIYVAGFERSILYHNNGDGTFTDVAKTAGVGDDGQWAVSAAFLDYDYWTFLWPTTWTTNCRITFSAACWAGVWCRTAIRHGTAEPEISSITTMAMGPLRTSVRNRVSP